VYQTAPASIVRVSGAMMHTKIAVLGALLLGVLLVACGESASSPSASASDPTGTATASAPATTAPSADAAASGDAEASADAEASGDAEGTLPDGWEAIAVADLGFSIGVPEGWEELSAETLADSAVIDEMIETNPDAAVALEQARVAIESGQIGLFAFDSADAGSGFATNLNVINVGAVTESPEEAAEQIAAAIEGSVPVLGEVSTGTTSVPAGEAATVRYEWELADAAGATTAVTVLQYAIITGDGTGYVISFSAASDRFAEDEETFRQIVDTFRATGD
jgi:hypothetical protein